MSQNPPEMPRRRFGRTELAMPVLTCGGMRYQQAWKDLDPSEIAADGQANLEATIRRAVAIGANHIETARGYGSSEMQLGRILPKLPRRDLIVQTKVWSSADPAEFVKHFETSMGYLGLDHVDLLALHGVNNEEVLEWSLRPGGCLDAAEKLRAAGRCRHIGFSTHGPPDVVLAAVATGRFDYVNLHWYYVYQKNWPAIEEARRQDMGVFIISPNDKGGKLYAPPEKLVRLCAPLSPMAFNDLFCLSRDEVHTLSIGAARPSDFDAHVEALRHYDRRVELSSEIAARIEAERVRVLGLDWVRNWDRGLPRWEDVPLGINLHEILRLWGLAQSLDLVAYGQMRYNLLGNGGHWFAGSNAAEAGSVDWARALPGYPFADRLPNILREAHAMLYQAPVKRLSESD